MFPALAIAIGVIIVADPVAVAVPVSGGITVAKLESDTITANNAINFFIFYSLKFIKLFKFLHYNLIYRHIP
jgi:hypothetical protein